MVGRAARLFARGGLLDVRRALIVARSRARQGLRRSRTSLSPILSASVGAAISWAVAGALLSQPAPFFAATSCWICLGFTKNRAPRAVVELAVGSAVGLAIGELFARAFGAGPWQVGAVLVIAALFGRLLDRGVTLTMQSSVNGMVIVGMASYPMAVGGWGRWADALIGGAVAFVITVVLPRNISERPRRYARSAIEEFAEALEMLAPALRRHNIEAMLDANGQLDAVGEALDDWGTALKAATDIARLNPILRGEQPHLDELSRLLALSKRAETSLTMIVRQSIGFSEQAGEIPGVASSIALAASATRSLAASVGGWYKPERARQLLKELADHSSPTEIDTEDWRPGALMALIRALAVDLLQMTGMSRADANSALAATLGAPFAVADEVPPEDEASQFWGGHYRFA